jgi:hypothetical protein
MKGFLFFSKVALLLNILFFVCLFLRYKPFVSSQALLSFLVIAGWILSVLVNFVVNLWLSVLLLQKKIQLRINSIVFFNAAVFIFQLLYFFL